MGDAIVQGTELSLSDQPLILSRPRPFCLVLEPSRPTQRDFLHEDLLAPHQREAFYSLVDETGLVIVRGAHVYPATYRDVRGRSSRGRLSQGEYFHHDGCSGPTKPRMVEIRCPHQDAARTIPTSVAPFPETIAAMLAELPPRLGKETQLAHECERFSPDLPREDLDIIQGMITRAIRRGLTAADARSYFLGVDQRCDAYAEPWQMGESRFIANENARRTMQHRRACPPAERDNRPNGNLLKRWPAEEL